MAAEPTVVLDHFTINVSDLDRSTRFYCEGLDFRFAREQVVGDEGAGPALVERPFRVRSRYLEGGGVLLVLNRTEVPAAPLPAYRRALGLANLAVRVDDLEARAARLVALGGTLAPSSRASFPYQGMTVDVLVVRDPDGLPIELIQRPRR